MDIGNWISILLAVVATASAIVAYSVYRSATDPLIIVYPEVDLQRASILILIIENIGNGAAKSIKFKTSRPLPDKAFSITEPKDMPNEMKSGPLIDGIPFLAPGQRITLTWGQYGGLHKFIGNDPIEVLSLYQRARTLPFTLHSPTLKSESCVFIKSFEHSNSSEYGFGPDIAGELKTLNTKVSELVSKIRR